MHLHAIKFFLFVIMSATEIHVKSGTNMKAHKFLKIASVFMILSCCALTCNKDFFIRYDDVIIITIKCIIIAVTYTHGR